MKQKPEIIENISGLAAILELMPARKKRIAAASSDLIVSDPINELADRIHPSRLHLIVSAVKDETKTIKTFRLTPDYDSGTTELPYFRAGQYLSFKLLINEHNITRPYSISSSPREALSGGFMEITIRRKDGGFATEYIWDNWAVGTKVESSGPCGLFYHEPLRDTGDIVCLAGGCGFTPFRSMMKDFIDKDSDVRATIIFGIRTPDEIVFKDELESLFAKSPDRFKIFYVCSEPTESWKGRSGFLSADLITELAGDPAGKTFFICGPPAMYKYLESEMKDFNLPCKRVRREVFGEVENISKFPEFPKDAVGKTFEIKVFLGNRKIAVPAISTESILVAMERAKLAPPSQCRSGECGFCDSLLISGDIFVSPENDGRREAGKKFGHFHPCSSYPLSDLAIKIPPNA